MAITSMDQLNARRAELAAADAVRKSEIGSPKTFLAQCETIQVCTEAEHNALQAYYTAHPAVLNSGTRWHKFVDSVLKSANDPAALNRILIRGTAETKAEFVKALQSVMTKTDAYYAALSTSLDMDGHSGTTLAAERETVAYDNFTETATAMGAAASRNMITLIRHKQTGEVIAASSDLAIAPRGSYHAAPSVSTVFGFVKSSFRFAGAYKMLEQASNQNLTDYFAFAAPKLLAEHGKFYRIGEVTDPVKAGLGDVIAEFAEGSDPFKRRVSWLQSGGQLDTGKPYIYMPYYSKDKDGNDIYTKPDAALVPYAAAIRIEKDAAGKYAAIGLERAAVPAAVMRIYYGNMAARWVGETDPVAADETGEVKKQLEHFKTSAAAGVKFGFKPDAEIKAEMKLWHDRYQAITSILGGDLSLRRLEIEIALGKWQARAPLKVALSDLYEHGRLFGGSLLRDLVDARVNAPEPAINILINAGNPAPPQTATKPANTNIEPPATEDLSRLHDTAKQWGRYNILPLDAANINAGFEVWLPSTETTPEVKVLSVLDDGIHLYRENREAFAAGIILAAQRHDGNFKISGLSPETTENVRLLTIHLAEDGQLKRADGTILSVAEIRFNNQPLAETAPVIKPGADTGVTVRGRKSATTLKM